MYGDPNIAYLDEYPWIRCRCGFILNDAPGDCPKCGDDKFENLVYRCRDGVLLDRQRHGTIWEGVPWEDTNRRLLVV